MVRRGTRGGIVCALLALATVPVSAQQIAIDPPGPNEFIRDNAGLLDVQDRQRIETLCASLLSEKAIPIIVVTITEMVEYGGEGMRIETFATLLYNQWEIGHEELGGLYWNRGVLLLVSVNDRQARIELGDGWDPQASAASRQIMDDHIVSNFKRGEFSKGIAAGVEALDKMGRGEKLPRKPVSWASVALIVGLAGLAIFTVVSLIRRGGGGWAWLFWGVVFSFVGVLLYSAMANRHRGGGGFSGGSFGGGFSGGGGATGSW